MALPSWYNQGYQNIYTGGQHYIPQENYRLNYTPNNLASTNTLPGITSADARIFSNFLYLSLPFSTFL